VDQNPASVRSLIEWKAAIVWRYRFGVLGRWGFLCALYNRLGHVEKITRFCRVPICVMQIRVVQIRNDMPLLVTMDIVDVQQRNATVVQRLFL